MESKTVDLVVEGMTCQGCVRHVVKALTGVPGVASADVSLAEGRARVMGEDDQSVHPDELIKAVQAAGYAARLA